MSRLFSRLLNIHPDEVPKVFMLVMIFFVFITGMAWAETVIESSFYYLVGVSQLSLVFTLHALVALISIAIYTTFVDRTSNQKLLVAVCVVAALAISLGVILLWVNQTLAYTILYVLVRTVRTSFVIHWWNYASDFYDAHTSKRIVPVINAASHFAIIVAGLTIPLLNLFLIPAAIILLWVVALLFIAILSWVMNNRVAMRDDSTKFLPALHRSTLTTRPKKEQYSYWRNIREGFQYVSSSNYLRWLALSTFLMVLVFALLNYQGGQIFTQQFKSRAEMTNFIGYLNGLTSLIMLLVQLFLFSRVVAKIGVGNTNVIFPLGTFLISGSVLLTPLSLASGALAHFDRTTFRYSIQESSNNLLYNAVPARVKGRSRSFIDGLILPVALLASSALLEFGKYLPKNLFLPVLLGLPALAYLLCSLVIRSLYSPAMIILLEQEDYASLLLANGDVALSADPTAKNILLKKLMESKDDAVILLIARIMTETAETTAIPVLEAKAKESTATLRAGIIDILATVEIQSVSRKSLVSFFTSFLDDPDERVRLAAFIGLQRSADTASRQFLDQAFQLLQDANYEIHSQALAQLLNSNDPTYLQPAEAALEKLLNDPDPRARICALGALGRNGEPRFLSAILAHLDEGDDQVRLQAAKALETYSMYQNILGENVQAILAGAKHLLNDPLEQVRLAILATLEHIHSQDSYELIASTLVDPSLQVRQAAAEILVRIGETAAPTLLGLLGAPENVSTQQTMLKAILCRINVYQYGDLADGQIQAELKTIYTRNAQLNAIQAFPTGPGVLALRTLLGELNHSSLDAIFELLSARHGEKSVEMITRSLAAESSHTRANASEALEALIDSSLVKLIMPLFDSTLSADALAQIGADTWETIRPVGAAQVMRQLTTNPQDEWSRAFAIYALGEIISTLKPAEAPRVQENRRQRRVNLLDAFLDDPSSNAATSPASPGQAQLISLPEAQELISAAQNDPSREVRNAALAAARLASQQIGKPSQGELMTASLSVIERIIFLKQVVLFQSMTIDQLKILASICEDEYVAQDTVIFKEGDPGGVVYVVVTGRVGIEREGDRKGSIVRLATLEERASFGEMNLFENSLRSANAFAIEDSLLLKVRAEPFVALIRQHPDISLEVIKVLNVRLRDADDQIAHLTRSMPRQLQKLYDNLEDMDEE
jgi:CRP-like cAMP-binding protein/HEAT repeat protein/ATP/ADP translocase